MRRVIFVHGINNEHRTQNEIETTWKASLKTSIGPRAAAWWDDVEFRTAYYADILAQESESWGKAQSNGARMGAESPADDFVQDDIAALYLELQRAYGIDDLAVASELADEDDIDFARPMAAGVHKKWLKAITRSLEKLVPSAGNGLASVFLNQAAAYLNKPGLFDQINALVEDQVLKDTPDLSQTVVVGHSLGTVIMYSLLRLLDHNQKMPQFVTLGSPLGIRIVHKRVGGPYIKPEVVDRWTNGADPSDFVALHPILDTKTFGPAEIINYATLDNGYKDAHSPLRYLEQPQIAEVIYSALK